MADQSTELTQQPTVPDAPPPQPPPSPVVTPAAAPAAPEPALPPEPPRPLTPAGSAQGEHVCPACAASTGSAGAASPRYVYALGRVEIRFPSLGVEKEYTQVGGRTDAAGLTDRELLRTTLTDPANRYLARQLCWVLTVEGLETYLLHPRDPADLSLLIEAVRPSPGPSDLDVVIGVRGPIAGPDHCNGLTVPVVLFDQIYSFDRNALIDSLPVPDGVDGDRYRVTAEEILHRTLQLSDNAGATDEHRALNYLAVRYPAVYNRAVESYADNKSLTGVEVRPSRLGGGTRTIVDVVFSYTHRGTDVTDKCFVRVDVSERFPFLVSKLQPYYDR
ncbi:hypothetical protein ACFP3U_26635 [Kitasatospora misakiensis]|uniref:PatG C-terminal domain-containing protein n=1 Tax=Kitasatospora misakiensis TaxID=67330 RepID=A0ABW0X7J6_9ACTN